VQIQKKAKGISGFICKKSLKKGIIMRKKPQK
jgi:hypothetical protein